jgi:hypothetical protein
VDFDTGRAELGPVLAVVHHGHNHVIALAISGAKLKENRFRAPVGKSSYDV